MSTDEGDWKGASWKQEEDFSKETEVLLKEINADEMPVLLRSSDLQVMDYIQKIFVLEKKSRLGGDTLSTQRLATEVMRILRTQKMYEVMLEQLSFLMKRRGQTKQVQSSMVTECALTLQDETISEAIRHELLEQLCHTTAGKIHVELDHARFTVLLAEISEKEGRKKEASDKLAAIQVETITTMPRLEKLDCLVNQLRLALEIGDYHLAPTISRKINYRALGRKDTKDLKCRYFKLMATYYNHTDSHLLVGRCWHEIYLTVASEDEKLTALSNVIVYCLVARHSSQKEIQDGAECAAFSPESRQEDRTEWLKELGKLKRIEEELVVMHGLIAAFNSVDLIRTSQAGAIGELCASHPVFADSEERQTELRNRLSEHDLVVVARYYKCIKIARLAELVGLTEEHVERFIMQMVGTKSIWAKIDRIDGIVVFEKKKNPTEVAAQWNESVSKMVGLIDKTAHLIVKERMINASPIGMKA